MDPLGRYDHIQRSRLHLILVLIAVLMAVGAWGAQSHPDPEAPWAPWLMFGIGALVLGLAPAFAHLRVRDEGDALRIAFGPLPVFRKRLPYADIKSAVRARSKLIDGWGIHWMPGRGWTWNLSGFDCVEVETTSGRLRIGTDDPDGLVALLRSRIIAGTCSCGTR